MKKVKDNFKVIWWAIRLAYRISPKTFLFWLFLSIVLAVLPSIALVYNRNAVSVLSSSISVR